MLGKPLEHEARLFDLLRRPGVSHAQLMTMQGGHFAPPDALSGDEAEQVEIAAKYAGYIERQQDEVRRAAAYEDMPLPADLDYRQVSALSIEARQKLQQHRPQTLGQAARLSGITPASISLLLIHLSKHRLGQFRSGEAGPPEASS